MKKQKIIIGVLAFIVMLSLSGCGPNVGEKIMEKTIESQTGGKVDIDADKGEMKINTGQGDISVSGDGTASLNKDFPKDIYIAPDAKIIMSLVNGQNKSYSVAYTTAMKSDEVYAKYKEDLTSQGWASDAQTEIIFQDSKTMLYKKGAQSLTLIMGISQDPQFKGRTHVQVIGAEDQSGS
jgi:hypothetical protein